MFHVICIYPGGGIYYWMQSPFVYLSNLNFL